MKARTIIKRNQPIEFPVLAQWTFNGEDIKDCIVLFKENKLGIAVVHQNPNNYKEFTSAWVPLDWKEMGKRSWKILGSPKLFGISLTEDKSHWTGTFDMSKL